MDVLHDNSFRKWLKIAELAEPDIPDYVREYTLIEEKTASDLSGDLYADSMSRLFPIDSPAATWLSAAYFATHRDQLPYKAAMAEHVEKRIAEAADVYGIADDVKQVVLKVAESQMQKSAAAVDDNYGWIEKTADGAVITRRYPMFDAEGVQKAAAYFEENRQHYPLTMRRAIAQSIMHKAAEYGLMPNMLDDSITREAGEGIPRRTVLMRELIERAHIAKDAEAGMLLLNINNLIGELQAGEVGQNLDKIAEVIDEFDQLEGLNKTYGIKVTHPADFLHGVATKSAEVYIEKSIKLNRLVFDTGKLVELGAGVFADVLGEKFAEDILFEDADKLKQALSELSPADKAALEAHIVELHQ